MYYFSKSNINFLAKELICAKYHAFKRLQIQKNVILCSFTHSIECYYFPFHKRRDPPSTMLGTLCPAKEYFTFSVQIEIAKVGKVKALKLF